MHISHRVSGYVVKKIKTALPSLSSCRLLSSSTGKEANVKNGHFDIVVSGGGMVGFAMVCALGQSTRLSDRKILLLEGAPAKSWELPNEFSNRVCALSKNTYDLFKNLGIWEHILSLRAQPVKRMQVWESHSEAMITFSEQDLDDMVAHIVENDVILEATKNQVSNNIEVMYGAKVNGYNLPKSIENKVEIFLGDETLSTDLLIGADGAKSLVRETMGTHYLKWEYDQMGIVATLELADPEENTTAWQKFLPTGPVALLPLSENRSSLVWSMTRDKAKGLLKLSDLDFTDALNNAIWQGNEAEEVVKNLHGKWLDFLEAFSPWGGSSGIHQLPPSISNVIPNTRAAFPLGLGHSVHYVGPRVALIGDAAHRVHPLAGQGVNLGFGDVASLTHTLEESILLGCDIGDERALHKYETDRQNHNVTTMASVDALYRLYSTSFLPVVLARSLGLSTVNYLGPLKKRIMQFAES